MGNSEAKHSNSHSDGESSESNRNSRKTSKAHAVALALLFQKLELSVDGGNPHPGELSKVAFENAFHGPLHKFGSLMYRKMNTSHHSGHGSKDQKDPKDRITKEHFIKAGKCILTKFRPEDYQPYYFDLFTAGKETLSKEDGLQMIHVCYALTLSNAKIPYAKNSQDDVFFQAIATSMFGVEESLTYEKFSAWLTVHMPHLFCGVHKWVHTVLTGSTLPSELEETLVPQLEGYVEGRYCLTLGMLWTLTTFLPPSYTHAPSPDQDPMHQAGTKNPMVNTYQLLLKMARLSQCQSWNLLYNSNEHGLSLNRFTHHVAGYRGPSTMVVAFEGRNLYCVASDVGWREGAYRFGGKDCMLVQLMPVFRVVQSGKEILLWNNHSREVPKGITLGQGGKDAVLSINTDFDSVTHYGVQCILEKVEVWGCGSQQALESQAKQKQWEARDVDRQRNRKLKLQDNDWRENPDKQILEWGGVRLSSSYNR